MRKLMILAVSGLGLFWLTGQIMFQLFVIETPRPAFYWLNAGNAFQIVAALLAIALLLVTNTRRPKGVDPDTPVPAKRVDPFALSAEEERAGVFLPDGRPYGRRLRDDTTVVKRLIDAPEAADIRRPQPEPTPQWALDLQQSAAATDAFAPPLVALDAGSTDTNHREQTNTDG
jgi:hypothetical protein